MSRAQKITLGAICSIALLMLFIIFNPFAKKDNQQDKNPSTNKSQSYVDNFLTITPESMQGKVVDATSANFIEKNKSGLTGTVTFKEINGKVFIGVILKGAVSPAPQPALIYEGSCEQEKSGRTLYSLSPVVKGRTENYLNGSLSNFKKQFPLAVKVHKSTQEINVDVACANLK